MKFEGIAVETAEDGLVALEKLNQRELPFLILLDLMMPVIDGWEFSKAIVADPRLQDIPIVVMTAFDDTSKELPPSLEVIKKPMSLATIRSTVRKYYERSAPKP